MNIQEPLVNAITGQAAYGAGKLLVKVMNHAVSEEPSVADWKGRTCMHYVVGCQFCTGTVSGAVAAYPYVAPACNLSYPTWIASPIGALVALVTCVGGGCLWWNIPEKRFETLVSEHKSEVQSFISEKNKLNKKIKNLEEKVSELEKKTFNINAMGQQITKKVAQSSHKLDITNAKANELLQQVTDLSSMAKTVTEEISFLKEKAINETTPSYNVEDQENLDSLFAKAEESRLQFKLILAQEKR